MVCLAPFGLRDLGSKFKNEIKQTIQAFSTLASTVCNAATGGILISIDK